ncbi:hypothetical protein [Catenovulum agarivorans]|uniref:hypothetical protein n=1 Tax=Catenovulum agarivorans TaxID=1172192 RepID=UPI0002D9F5EF|nr:hypothetical protein [Catenovulum agarivorans]
MVTEIKPRPFAGLVVAKSLFALCKQHQQLMQMATDGASDTEQLKSLANKLAQTWLAPSILNSCFTAAFINLPLVLPRAQKRYLSSCLLLIVFADIYKLHPKLLHKLLIAASLRDISILKLLQQPKLDKKHLLASALQSAQQVQQRQLGALAQLIAWQYTNTPNALFSQQVFSLVCLIVHQQSLNPTANWLQILKTLVCQDGSKIQFSLLESLFKYLTDLPAGSLVVEQKQQQLHYLMHSSEHEQDTICVSLTGVWHHFNKDSLALAAISSAAEQANKLSFKQVLEWCQHKSCEFIKQDEKPANVSQHLSLTALKTLLAHFHQSANDPVDLLNQDIQALPYLHNALCTYASELAESNAPINKTRHAIMMLGLNRVYYWLIRYQIESFYIQYQYDHQNLHQLYLLQAQSVAENLANKLKIIDKEQAKLMVSLAFMPYLNAPQIQTYQQAPEFYSHSPELIFKHKKHYPQALLDTLKNDLRLEDWCLDALVALQAPSKLHNFNRKTQQTFALLVCACTSVGLSYVVYDSVKMSEALPQPLQQALTLLNLDFTSFQQIQQENSQDNNLYSPLPRLIR